LFFSSITSGGFLTYYNVKYTGFYDMYFSIVFVIFALLLVFIFATCRRRWAVKKVYSMCCKEKCTLLNGLIAPFGYCYIECQDIISSRNDAWQRDMGYTSLFDHMAPHFNMVFDCLPVYFDYGDRTWLIEFWKGQYGINTGAEIGVYYADRLLSEEETGTFLFKTVEDQDMLPLYFELTKGWSAGCPCTAKPPLCNTNQGDHLLASVSKRTWWLTAFCMGRFSRPEELYMNSSIHFPDCEMRCQFMKGLQQAGLSKEYVRICGNTVHILYGGVDGQKYGFFALLKRKLSQVYNRVLCRIYLLLTHPFTLTLDRLLYLYFLLPFIFRKTLSPCRYGTWHVRGKRKR